MAIATLTKDDGANDISKISRLLLGVSWDPSSGTDRGLLGWARKKVGDDLDLIAVACTAPEKEGGRPVPARYAGLSSTDPMKNRSVLHSGDNQTGHGDGDDETVAVTFADVPAPVISIVFLAAAFKKGTSFANVANISFKVYDASDGQPEVVADIWPSLLGKTNVNAVARASRGEDGLWTLEVLNESSRIKQGDMEDLLEFAASHAK